MDLLDIFWLFYLPEQDVEVSDCGVIKFAPEVFRHESKKLVITIRAIKYQGNYYSGVNVHGYTFGMGYSPHISDRRNFKSVRELVRKEVSYILELYEGEIDENAVYTTYHKWLKDSSNI